MKSRLMFAVAVLTLLAGISVLPGTLPAAHAVLPIMPFISGWNPFDEQVHVDEPDPTGSIIQLACGGEAWVWDRPMSVYPETIQTPEGVRICMSFPTPQSKGVRQLWWTDDPRLKSREKFLNAKSFKDLPPDIVWHETTEIYNGQFSFVYKPKHTGLQVVRVVGMIDEAKEVTRHPLPFVKSGDYKGQLRGGQVRWIVRSPFTPGTDRYEPCLLGTDGRLNIKRICQTLFNEGSGGHAIPLDWRNEPGPGSNALVPVAGALMPPPSSAPNPTPSAQPTDNGLRWAVPVSHGQVMTVCLKWPDGSTSDPIQADGKNTVAIPEGMTSFQAFVWDGKSWVCNYPLQNGRLQYDDSGKPVLSYPVPERAGGRITFDVAVLAPEQVGRGK